MSRLKYRLPVDRYLGVSQGVLAVMRAAGIPSGRLALVPDGIELPGATAAPPSGPDLRELIGAPAGAPVVGTVAALAPHKNHAELLRAAAIVTAESPDTHFVWVGEGECRPALEAEREALGLAARVHLLGFRDDALALLAQFTLFALSSHLEGLCTSLLDAQALGVPIVATRVGGIPEVVDGGRTGTLVPSGRPAELARAILAAVAAPEESRRMAAAARLAVREFSAERMVERTLDEYLAVLGPAR